MLVDFTTKITRTQYVIKDGDWYTDCWSGRGYSRLLGRLHPQSAQSQLDRMRATQRVGITNGAL